LDGQAVKIDTKTQWAIGGNRVTAYESALTNMTNIRPLTTHCAVLTEPQLLTVDCSRLTDRGFTLIEMVMTVAVLTIMTMSVIPVVQISVRRQKEQQLREALSQIRSAISQFHREAIAAPINPQGQTPGGQPQLAGNAQGQTSPNFFDPRIRVYINAPEIFTSDNADLYPPDLDTLKNGVDVLPMIASTLGARGNLNVNATDAASEQAAAAKHKTYLREIPIDPMTGEADWDLRSCYQTDSDWDRINVFEVHSKSKGTSLNGEKYSDW
jgi:general secretion pathway protein G